MWPLKLCEHNVAFRKLFVTTSIREHYSFLMSRKSSCFAAAWDLAPCPHSQCLFCYVLLMPTKFSCLAAAWDLAPCPHFHYLPNDLLHHQAGDRKGKVSNFRWLRDRKIGSGILSSSVVVTMSTSSWWLNNRHIKLPVNFNLSFVNSSTATIQCCSLGKPSK